MVGLEMAARTDGLAYSALPPAGGPAEVVSAYASPLEAWLVRLSPAPCPHLMSLALSPFVARQHGLKRCVSPLWCGAHPVPRGAPEHGPRMSMSPHVTTGWGVLLPGPAGGDRPWSGIAAGCSAGQSGPRPP